MSDSLFLYLGHVAELARHFGVSETSLRKELKRRKITPAKKDGPRHLFHFSDAERAAKSCKTRAHVPTQISPLREMVKVPAPDHPLGYAYIFKN